MSAARPTAAVTRADWRVLALLVVSVCLNYIARSGFSVAAPAMSSELGLSPSDLGPLLSAFFCLYAVSPIAAGWLVDRYDVNWVLRLGFLAWSVVGPVQPMCWSRKPHHAFVEASSGGFQCGLKGRTPSAWPRWSSC